MVAVQERFTSGVVIHDFLFDRFSLRADRLFLLLVLVDVGEEFRVRIRVAGGQRGAEFSEIFLLALRLVIVPLVRRFGLPDGGLVLVVQREVFAVAALIGAQRADRREDGRDHGHAARERIRVMMARVFHGMVVRTMYFVFFRHLILRGKAFLVVPGRRTGPSGLNLSVRRTVTEKVTAWRA
ncbi:protein of unknown function [Paraburkholderia dioscoreae]|uniref:Uncharacterized protein n=1 Tax=Paraburkholderia dioscoreae TaxID=2604047 RepID=A0A5Q4YX05_9BURK|nr:protein of unknown function [Paraburkholderia dioscoreae]